MNAPVTSLVQHETKLYKNHSGKIGYWSAQLQVDASGKAMIVISHAKTLDGKAVTSSYEVKGKNIGRANETTPVEQGALEIDSRANKQRDKGYVDTVELAQTPATNTLGLEKPMLATPIEKVKPESIDWKGAYMQPKLDGHRALWKDGVLYSRQGKVLDLPHIVEAIKTAGLEHLHLDGELYCHGLTLQQISSLVKRQQDDTLKLVYHVYDIVSDEPYFKRLSTLINTIAYSHLVSQDKALRPVPTRTASSMIDVTAFQIENLENGYEGTMLRTGMAGYETDKRSRNLLKVKDFQDEEFKILEVVRGTPALTPQGVFEVPVFVLDAGNGKTFRATAQGNREEKHAIWETRAEHVGKQLTLKFFNKSKDGIPILPVAIRFREDV